MSIRALSVIDFAETQTFSVSPSSGTAGTPTALTDSNGTYTASCPALTSDATISLDGHKHSFLQDGAAIIYCPDKWVVPTYPIIQNSIEDEYNSATTYNIGDLCVYHGELWQRSRMSGSGVAPASGGSLWTRVKLTSLIKGSADVGVVTCDPSLHADMSDGPGVIIVPSNVSPMLAAVGITFDNLSLSGMLSVELHIGVVAGNNPNGLRVAGSGVTWIRGTLSDIMPSGNHIVRIRMFADQSAVYAEYIGSY